MSTCNLIPWQEAKNQGSLKYYYITSIISIIRVGLTWFTNNYRDITTNNVVFDWIEQEWRKKKLLASDIIGNEAARYSSTSKKLISRDYNSNYYEHQKHYKCDECIKRERQCNFDRSYDDVFKSCIIYMRNFKKRKTDRSG